MRRRILHISIGTLCLTAAVVFGLVDAWWVACGSAVVGVATLLYTPRQR